MLMSFKTLPPFMYILTYSDHPMESRGRGVGVDKKTTFVNAQGPNSALLKPAREGLPSLLYLSFLVDFTFVFGIAVKLGKNG